MKSAAALLRIPIRRTLQLCVLLSHEEHRLINTLRARLNMSKREVISASLKALSGQVEDLL